MISKAQIIVTIGPASEKEYVLEAMLEHGMDVVRFNFAWSDFGRRESQLETIRRLERKHGKKIPIIQDLPGSRKAAGGGHSYEPGRSGVTEQDRKSLVFGAEKDIDWVALSFVASAEDVEAYRREISNCRGKQKIIAKIERKEALENLYGIINSSDAIMIARGDLGHEVSLEKIPFIQADIISKCKAAGKPVITATEMFLSMVRNDRPSRAEVTDVANAILQGSDAVMLSEETSVGEHPVEAVTAMEKVILEAERHLAGKLAFRPL
ncbi:MAG: Pyruvate kinase [Parcubacteria group bacterium GW2011_GWB1_49_7]|uniref:pyruvate kinase n=1 Tax=Candidatus Zambryskibacteria bacterium RIFCSPHIGHO2_01_FULL_46_25 TaxID=1802738 RepID=A0A1G2T0K0_9BACT|nr:MAG: Pyruvate kinase [Parcubacteria group bacterium GW2011_GWA1_47_10]KKW10005.1 MAG: Pyruvate kinase [Parcubacteria group bacterium GW2011_GWB1_49_7]OHA90359.1 MAG: hypothetical protein A2838_02035 [Candidatus Zambryskibacteria bacterium RIFCSPHIGHO2_01_FULL_46_25]OHB01487.1 MAG: hypothetical protein A3F53_02160 [Candidatus Zambryskibacteria bacterium RIFCSPHIGHO2_12_FULL_48_10]OHB06897.1 MAG: hypothetical protein A3A31_01170 [Candidatus Zambryskibacteria bacterium RIFCSPLOWO2_01_FULL_48_25